MCRQLYDWFRRGIVEGQTRLGPTRAVPGYWDMEEVVEFHDWSQANKDRW
jgi:hypothetical protein